MNDKITTNEQWQVLLVDDEQLACDLLNALVAKHPAFEVCKMIQDGFEAIEICQTTAIDVVLLDIEMPGINGLEVVKILQGLAHPPVVIFVTAFQQHALSAFELSAVDYVMKPINKTRFQEVLDKVHQQLLRQQQWLAAQPILSLLNNTSAAMNNHLIVKTTDDSIKVTFQQIMWIQASNQYAQIHLKTGQQHVVSQNLQQLSKQLPMEQFIRVHRSAMINIDALLKVEKKSNCVLLTLQDGTPLTLARSRKALLPILQAQVQRD